MIQSPKNCIVCGTEGVADAWNNIGVLVCPDCGLAWMLRFGLSPDYYVNLNEGRSEVGEGKAVSRLRNAKDRFEPIRKFLPRTGICDVGCGDGSFLLVLKDEGYKDCWGIEPSTYSLQLALKKQLEVIKGDISVLRLPGQKKINVLTVFHVIEHFSDPIEAVSIFREALGTGGLLVLETPDSNASIQKVTNRKNALINHEHLFYWNEKSLRMILKKFGFRILAIKRRSFDWKNAPIRASLARLGLLDDPHVNLGNSEEKVSGEKGLIHNGNKIRDNFFRKLTRNTLAYLVHMLGKDDYIFVVAERV